MRLDELEDIIANTDQEHWSVIGEGPTFLYDFELSGAYDDQRITHVGQHSSTAVLRGDVDVRIAWGFDPDHDRDRRLNFFEEHTFADEIVYRELGDLLYRGALVQRYWLIHVDGGRATLPMPTTRRRPAAVERERRYELTTTQAEIDFARLVDALTGGQEFDSYLRTSGIIVR